ncbi:Tn3 family transposase [Azohydromonas lata]|uniref:Tn3 family transposase n=1 Tax=Azohydromonas lata TaxID=45677 RepID=A0ABU5I738_9BURK|nr:Tn3 family transposase [Azohydromonas lata]MDZ5454945.1 Tn3 family transposase [Azohydromonas lata]
MSAFANRFVGQSSLPARLSEFDREYFFSLSKADIAALNEQFRDEHRLAAALMVLFMRAAGRTLDGFTVIPRNLLRYAAEAVGVSAPSIASLRAIYRRRQTHAAHQRWAKDYLALTDLTPADEDALTAALKLQAQEAAHTDDLIEAAKQWLFSRQVLIPSPYRLLDWARVAFAEVEAQVVACVSKSVPPAAAKQLLKAVYTPRPQGEGLTIEWLKAPPRRHSPTTLATTMEKIRYLKSLGAHTWDLTDVVLAKQRAYARQIQARRPVKSREIRQPIQLVEVVCFLRVTLLELTDSALQQAGRRSQQLLRAAAERAQARRGNEATELLAQAVRVKGVLHDDSKSWQERVLEAQRLLSGVDAAAGTSSTFAARVRVALTQDPQRVHACLAVLDDLDFQGHATDAGFVQWQAWRGLRQRNADERAAPGALPDVGPAWQLLVSTSDPKAAWQAFEASTMMALRRSVRRGSVWVDHSLSFRERDQMLIPQQQWALHRKAFIDQLGLPETAAEFIKPLIATLVAGLWGVVGAIRRGQVEIGRDGMLHLSKLAAMPNDREPRRTREAIYRSIGAVQLPDVILEVDAATNFSDTLLGHRARSMQELLALYGALLAHGTELDASEVALMIPELELTQILAAMRSIESGKRLRRANERIVQYQSSIPMAALWGDGDKASADMMALDVSRQLWNARVDPRRRTYAAGIYTHLRDRWGIVYDQPIVLNERQAGVAIEGVEQFNRVEDRIRLSLLCVDSHGHTSVAMGVAKLLGFDLCPRLRNLAERKLFLPHPFSIPEELESVVDRRVSLRAIERGWDELLRLAASIRTGRVSAALALQRLGSAARGDLVHRAADHLGRLLRTIFLSDYMAVNDFRREIHMLLDRGESVHLLQRAVYSGKVSPERGRRADEMCTISGSLTLLANVVIAWNTSRMEAVVDRLRKSGVRIEDDWLRRMGPAHFGHINFRGTMRFGIERYAHSLINGQDQPVRQLRLI